MDLSLILNKKEQYTVFLESDFWQKLSKDKRDLIGKCEKCGSKKKLQAHHLLYRNNWYETKLEDLQVLCRKCHLKEHGLLSSFKKNKIKRKSKRMVAKDRDKKWIEVRENFINLIYLFETTGLKYILDYSIKYLKSNLYKLHKNISEFIENCLKAKYLPNDEYPCNINNIIFSKKEMRKINKEKNRNRRWIENLPKEIKKIDNKIYIESSPDALRYIRWS